MSFPRVNPGQRLRMPAKVYNALLGVAEREGLGLPTGPDGIAVGALTPTTCLVCNKTELELPRFGIAAYTAPLFEPDGADVPDDFTARTVVIAEDPLLADHAGKFAVLRDPIPPGQFGTGVLVGVTVARVQVGNENHGFADVADGSLRLVSDFVGTARILWKEAGTGVKWAIVHIGLGLRREAHMAVIVDKDGGADGTSTTPATWTYTVNTLTGWPIANNVPLARRRPNGMMQFAPTDSYGVAFWDGMTLKLWEVDEIPDTEAC